MLMAQGATIVFPDDPRRVDPDDVWSTVERERTNMTVVGDAVLRPLLLQLDRKQSDLSSSSPWATAARPSPRLSAPWRWNACPTS